MYYKHNTYLESNRSLGATSSRYFLWIILNIANSYIKLISRQCFPKCWTWNRKDEKNTIIFKTKEKTTLSHLVEKSTILTTLLSCLFSNNSLVISGGRLFVPLIAQEMYGPVQGFVFAACLVYVGLFIEHFGDCLLIVRRWFAFVGLDVGGHQ